MRQPPVLNAVQNRKHEWGVFMTEYEKMQHAKTYIDKLANGINPIDDTPAAPTDIINNISISRCLF